MKALSTALLAGASLSACAMPAMKSLPADPPAPVVQPTSNQGNQGWASKPIDEPNLYARDGSVVGGQEPGTVAVSPTTGQNSTTDDGSRWTLLEQYQSVVQDKEELDIEVHALGTALDQSEAREASLRTELAHQKELATQSKERLEALESDNLELASRLTTAQIRRLQSEKLLLEAKLDWKRVQLAINAPESQTPSDSPALEAIEPVLPEAETP